MSNYHPNAVTKAALVSALALGAAHAAPNCAALAKYALPQASITLAQQVDSGGLAAAGLPKDAADTPGGNNLAGHTQSLDTPAFCRVAATLKPSSDSAIKIELWLPLEGWNGKFLGVANGGWAGVIPYAGMTAGVTEGYAAAGTDTGHDAKTYGRGANFSIGHPEKLIDYAYRADHLMTVDSKKLIAAFYGRPARLSYLIGCSLGGIEALIEAKKFPADYNGIVSGAPPNPLPKFNAAQLWPGWLVAQDNRRAISKDTFAMIHAAVLKQCAGPIGAQQGFVDDPDKCNFDPAELQCKNGQNSNCLTSPQVFEMQQTYQGPINPRTKQLIFPGPARGSELELFPFASTTPFFNAVELYSDVVYQDPKWDWTKMNFDTDVAAAEAKLGPLMDVDADLRPFFRHGGKLLLYIGWNDYHNPDQLISYYKQLMSVAGPTTRASARLFTIPGMNHCSGGAGCDTFNKLGVIDAWVDLHQAPERIIASKVQNDLVVRTRPICAWPMVAKYKGTGDIANEASFDCVSEGS